MLNLEYLTLSLILFILSTDAFLHHSKVTNLQNRNIPLYSSKNVNSETVKTVPGEEERQKKNEYVQLSPGEEENKKFVCNDDTVEFWKEFNRDGTYETENFIAVLTDVSNRFLTLGGEALGYWSRHTARSGYFVTNAALGTISSQLHERIIRRSSLRNDSASSENSSNNSFLNTAVEALPRILAEVAVSYEQDYERISQGIYKLPYDMYTRNRQNSPLYFGTKTVKFIREAVGTLSRRNRGSDEDKRVWLDSNDKLYPEYYKNAFHYQTDGWMSQDSADIYETSTETLFLGGQDTMQRTALVPLMTFVNEVKKTKQQKPLKVLEVGCGTGRFLTFVRDNLPLDSECTAIDLSPFYLSNARDNDKNWISIRKRVEATSGNPDIQINPATFVQAKGEDLPFEDEEFDVVISMYLFHEIPRDIRAQISSEMERVTKKGGLVILTDSIQKGDRPVYDNTIGRFEKMNEPYYGDYITDYLPTHFEKVGLECTTKTMCRSTKTLAFRKPME